MKITTTRGAEIEVEFVGIGSYSSAIVALEIPKIGLKQKDARFFPNTARTPYIEFQEGKCEITRQDSEKLWALLRAAIAEKEAAEKAEKEERRRQIIDGEMPVEVFFHDGEYLSGWKVFDEASDLLIEMGTAHYVEGWGVHVDGSIVRDLGKVFSYADAVEYLRPVKEAKAKADAEKAESIEVLKVEAIRTGQRVEISHHAVECDDPGEECDIDIITEWAMPNGTTKITRGHTW